MVAELVGIVNITPDSFSDGGHYNQVSATMKHIDTLLADGADWLDLGAESTRPGAQKLHHEEEWQRLQPVLNELKAQNYSAKISIDSYHPEIIEKALALGVIDMINDVNGLQDPAMQKIASQCQLPCVMMHSLSVPADPKIILAQEKDPIKEITIWAKTQLEVLSAQGISHDRIILDPGIGFSKNQQQSIEIIKRIDEFSTLNVPLYVGHSRKRFLTQWNSCEAVNRDVETLSVSSAIYHKVDYLRVHNIALHRRFFNVVQGL